MERTLEKSYPFVLKMMLQTGFLSLELFKVQILSMPPGWNQKLRRRDQFGDWN